MNSRELKQRTKDFALRIIKLVDAMPNTINGRTVANQISRSGTSIAANYRAALRARSDAEFISKVSIVIEEADETLFWLEVIKESNLLPEKRLIDLYTESSELLAIFCATKKSKTKSSGEAAGKSRHAVPSKS